MIDKKMYSYLSAGIGVVVIILAQYVISYYKLGILYEGYLLIALIIYWVIRGIIRKRQKAAGILRDR